MYVLIKTQIDPHFVTHIEESQERKVKEPQASHASRCPASASGCMQQRAQLWAAPSYPAARARDTGFGSGPALMRSLSNHTL